MKKTDEIIKKISRLASKIDKDIYLMEVCGTHTQTVRRFGIRDLMPANIKLMTGPGCPVCVTDQKDIDIIIALAKAGIPIASYGDVLRVPGTSSSLEKEKAQGALVFDVYSVDEALKIKKQHKDLVFFGLGFETSAPATAYAILKGLTVYSTHKLFLPAMQALLEMGEIKIDGFLAPGHVSTIIGVRPYEKMKVPQIIAGFTGEDVLVAIYMLLKQIKEGRQEVENEYIRAVKKGGNKKAYDIIFDVFEISAGIWRGFGKIPKSGLEIKEKYQEFDAKVKYKDIISKLDLSKSKEPKGCLCSDIIRGLCQPKDCPMFGRVCTVENPYGPCMVSSEGACSNEIRNQ